MKGRAILLAIGLAAWLLAPQALAADSGDGRGKAAEGIGLFRSGDFAAAERAFTEADVALPENPRIAFGRGCALQALDDFDKAAGFYRQAALARDAELAAAARFNLGTLGVRQAMAVFGEHPEAAEPEQREEGLGFLQTAVRHFRDCLDVKPGHQDAQYNLEALRTWIKHMSALWEEADRQKQRDEMNLLQFLEMIQRTQLEIRTAVEELTGLDDSPKRREALGMTESDQRTLRDEIEYLKEKITVALKPAAGQPVPAGGQSVPTGGQSGPSVEEIEKGLALLHNWSDEAAEQMIAAADLLAGGSPAAAPAPQWEAFERLDRIFGALAPFQAMVMKAIEVEQGLVDETRPLAGDEEAGDGTGGSKEPLDAGGADWIDMERFQERVTRWAGVLPIKAEQAAAQLESMPPGQVTPGQIQPGQIQPGEEEARQALEEQLKEMKKACEKAVELAPRIEELSQETARLLQDEKPAEALPGEEEILTLLEEIASHFPRQEQDQQQQDEQQDEQGDQQEQQQPQEKQDRPMEQDQRKVDAEAVLRKAQERERKHKEERKKMMDALGRTVTVEKDW